MEQRVILSQRRCFLCRSLCCWRCRRRMGGRSKEPLGGKQGRGRRTTSGREKEVVQKGFLFLLVSCLVFLFFLFFLFFCVFFLCVFLACLCVLSPLLCFRPCELVAGAVPTNDVEEDRGGQKGRGHRRHHGEQNQLAEDCAHSQQQQATAEQVITVI